MVGFHCAEHIVGGREFQYDGVGALREINGSPKGGRFRYDGVRRCREYKVSVALLRRSLFLSDETERLKESDLRVKPLAVWALKKSVYEYSVG